MPCGICKQTGHNRVTCPQKESQQGVYGPRRTETYYPPLTVPPISPIQALQDEIEAVNKEKNEALNQVNNLKTYIKYRAEEWVRMRSHVASLENQVNALKKANLLCDMKLRKDLAETLFDKKTELPDGLYLELMNKLRI